MFRLSFRCALANDVYSVQVVPVNNQETDPESIQISENFDDGMVSAISENHEDQVGKPTHKKMKSKGKYNRYDILGRLKTRYLIKHYVSIARHTSAQTID